MSSKIYRRKAQMERLRNAGTHRLSKRGSWTTRNEPTATAGYKSEFVTVGFDPIPSRTDLPHNSMLGMHFQLARPKQHREAS